MEQRNFNCLKNNFKQSYMKSGTRYFIMAGELAFTITRKSLETTMKLAYEITGFTIENKPGCVWITSVSKIHQTH